jgi:hypothetical protein
MKNKNGTLFSRVPLVIIAISVGDYCTPVRELLILLNTLPMTGPRINKTAITTTATKTRIKAYSTRPWPFSFGANNMGFYLLSDLDFPECQTRDNNIIYQFNSGNEKWTLQELCSFYVINGLVLTA